jgi:NAD(P)-dependent dehydrogenase (short-subunit alcohol dehydrogenase family)
MRLAGRVALITGASRGIGRAIAMELAREGADIAVNYRKQAAAAEETAAEILALRPPRGHRPRLLPEH